MKQAVLRGVDPVSALAGKVLSGGRLNLGKTLNFDSVAPRATLSSAPNILVRGGTTQDVAVRVTDNVAVNVSSLGGKEKGKEKGSEGKEKGSGVFDFACPLFSLAEKESCPLFSLRFSRSEAQRRALPATPRSGEPNRTMVRSVVRGWLNYFAVPGTSRVVDQFVTQVERLWLKQLRRRSQRGRRLTWHSFSQLSHRWIPQARIVHPYPNQRLRDTTRGKSRMK